MEVADPVGGVLEDEGAHVLVVDAERGAPRRARGGVEVLAGDAGVGAAVRPDVVVDDVEDHGEIGAVGRVDERREVGRAAVRVVRREGEHAVVAPVARAGGLDDGHELDGGGAEGADAREDLGERAERALGGRRAHVQLVEDEILERAAAEILVGPGEQIGVLDARGAVDAERLASRGRVGDGRRAVDREAVQRAHDHTAHGQRVEAVGLLGHADAPGLGGAVRRRTSTSSISSRSGA